MNRTPLFFFQKKNGETLTRIQTAAKSSGAATTGWIDCPSGQQDQDHQHEMVQRSSIIIPGRDLILLSQVISLNCL